MPQGSSDVRPTNGFYLTFSVAVYIVRSYLVCVCSLFGIKCFNVNFNILFKTILLCISW